MADFLRALISLKMAERNKTTKNLIIKAYNLPQIKIKDILTRSFALPFFASFRSAIFSEIQADNKLAIFSVS